MLRAVALVALMATSWPHAVALECALGSALPMEVASGHEHHGAPATEAAPSERSAHDHPAGHGPHHAADAGAPAGQGDCAMVMACSVVMIETRVGAALAEPVDAGEERQQAAPRSPSETDLTADPPPPRHNA